MITWPIALVLAVTVGAGTIVLLTALGASVVLLLTVLDRVLCFIETVLNEDYHCQADEDDADEDDEDDAPVFPSPPPDQHGESRKVPPTDPEVDTLEL